MKGKLLFSEPKGSNAAFKLSVPCGQCTGCRLDYSRQWAVRAMHESQMHQCNSFINLTFAPEHLPANHSIAKEHLQKFFKRLRKNTGKNFRYFACGEYGEKKRRPHYHAIIFGYDFSDDRYIWQLSKHGHPMYRSPMLEKCWTFGHSLIGSMTWESAAYVARYVMKKRKGDDDKIDPKTGLTNAEYYQVVDPDTGEVSTVEREFCLMSRGSGLPNDPPLWRYGLGRGWLENYKSDTDKDFITLNGKKFSLPRYYDSVLEMADAADMLNRKRERRKKINLAEQAPERLKTKARLIDMRHDLLIRPYHEEVTTA